MKIKINSVEINAEVLPLTSQTLDESLDIFSFALIINDQANPFTPFQKVELEINDNETLEFVLSSDSVEIASFNPIKYKHNIQCTQNTKELEKHIVRNSVFSQPFNPWEVFSQPHSYCLGHTTENTSLPTTINRYYAELVPSAFSISSTNYIEKVSIGNRKKIKKVYINIDLRIAINTTTSGVVATGEWYYPKSRTELIDHISPNLTYSTMEVRTTIPICYVDENGVTQTEYLSSQTLMGTNDFLFNQDVRSTYIESLIKRGCTNIYIKDYDSGVQLISGTFYAGAYIQNEVLDKYNSIVFYNVNYKFRVETYYYSCYDILKLLIDRQKQTYNGHSKTELFKLRTDDDLYDLLNDTIAPNFTFTQCTMYECIAEVFRLFDAIFTMDSDGYLGIEYFNERNGEQLPSTTKLVGANLSLGENRFSNKLVSYYQNAIQEITHPSNQTFNHVNNDYLGVPSLPNVPSYVVEIPIEEVTKCEILLSQVVLRVGWGSSVSEGFATKFTVTGSFLLDLTSYTIKENLWGTLDLVYNESNIKLNPRHLYQANTISYNNNKIDFTNTFKFSNGEQYFSCNIAIICAYWWQLGLSGAGLYSQLNDIDSFYIDDPDITFSLVHVPDLKEICMRVKYLANIDGRTINESSSYKYNGEEIIDQYNGRVDLEKMGLNMLGISYKTGEPTLNVNQKISTWANRIKKGQILTFNNEEWIANVCSYTILQNGMISGQISFVKNFNALSLNTRLIRERRLSQISESLVQKSEDNIIEYVYYDVEAIDIINDNLSISAELLFDAIMGSFSSDYFQGFYGIDSARIKSSDNGLNNWIYIPLIKYPLGNGVCFEVSYQNPISAGNRTRWITDDGLWFGKDKWYTDYIKYTDNNGFADYLSVQFVRRNSINTTSYNVNDSNFPIYDSVNQVLINLNQYYVYKQPNEVFALNYELVFIPVNKTDVFLYPRFFKESTFVSTENLRKKIYIVTSENKFSIFDLTANDYEEKTLITNITASAGSIIFSIAPGTSIDTQGIKGVAICDEFMNLLFAYNLKTTVEEIDHVTIYLGFAQNRSEDLEK